MSRLFTVWKTPEGDAMRRVDCAVQSASGLGLAHHLPNVVSRWASTAATSSLLLVAHVPEVSPPPVPPRPQGCFYGL